MNLNMINPNQEIYGNSKEFKLLIRIYNVPNEVDCRIGFFLLCRSHQGYCVSVVSQKRYPIQSERESRNKTGKRIVTASFVR